MVMSRIDQERQGESQGYMRLIRLHVVHALNIYSHRGGFTKVALASLLAPAARFVVSLSPITIPWAPSAN